MPVVRITCTMLKTFQEYLSNIKEPQKNKIVTYYKVLEILSKKTLGGSDFKPKKKRFFGGFGCLSLQKGGLFLGSKIPPKVFLDKIFRTL